MCQIFKIIMIESQEHNPSCFRGKDNLTSNMMGEVMRQVKTQKRVKPGYNNIIIQIFISTTRHELADHIFCIPMSHCLIADTEVPENAHMAYRVKFLLNEMIMS